MMDELDAEIFFLLQKLDEYQAGVQLSIFSLLRVDASTPLETIKRVYHQRCRLLHPDKNQNRPGAVHAFQFLSSVYETSMKTGGIILDDKPKKTSLSGINIYRNTTTASYKAYDQVCSLLLNHLSRPDPSTTTKEEDNLSHHLKHLQFLLQQQTEYILSSDNLNSKKETPEVGDFANFVDAEEIHYHQVTEIHPNYQSSSNLSRSKRRRETVDKITVQMQGRNKRPKIQQENPNSPQSPTIELDTITVTTIDQLSSVPMLSKFLDPQYYSMQINRPSKYLDQQ